VQKTKVTRYSWDQAKANSGISSRKHAKGGLNDDRKEADPLDERRIPKDTYFGGVEKEAALA